MSATSRHLIGEVARLTGLTIDTIRAWERRYQAVAPQRGPRGRTYADTDVDRLRLLRAATDRGHAIGTIVSMSDEALRRLADAGGATSTPRPALRDQIDLEPLAQAVDRYDADALSRLLGRLSVAVPPRDFVFDVILPLLVRTGDAWEDGRICPAQEHLLSQIVRDRMGTMLRTLARTDVPVQLIFATPPGEQHEFGILAAALLAASRGLGVLYLGPDLPPEDLVRAARHVRPRAVVIGLTVPQALRDELRALPARLPRGVTLWAGGAEHQAVGPAGRRVFALDSMQAFEHQLAKVRRAS